MSGRRWGLRSGSWCPTPRAGSAARGGLRPRSAPRRTRCASRQSPRPPRLGEACAPPPTPSPEMCGDVRSRQRRSAVLTKTKSKTAACAGEAIPGTRHGSTPRSDWQTPLFGKSASCSVAGALVKDVPQARLRKSQNSQPAVAPGGACRREKQRRGELPPWSRQTSYSSLRSA